MAEITDEMVEAACAIGADRKTKWPDDYSASEQNHARAVIRAILEAIAPEIVRGARKKERERIKRIVLDMTSPRHCAMEGFHDDCITVGEMITKKISEGHKSWK